MTVSNGMLHRCCKTGPHVAIEPGFYADGRFGVRIENVLIVKKAKTLNDFGMKGYLCYEHVTLVSLQAFLKEMNMNIMQCSALCRRL